MSEDTVRFGQTLRKELGIRDPGGGGMIAADALPTWSMYEDANDTAIRTGTFVAKAAVTGKYRMSESLTKANTYELFKFYTLWAETLVNGIVEHRPIKDFYLMPPTLSLFATVATVTDDGDFTIVTVADQTLPATDNAVNDAYLVHCSGNNKGIARKITDYVESTGQLLFSGSAGDADEPFPRTVAVDDIVEIIGLNR
jgi:hypothetical protein